MIKTMRIVFRELSLNSAWSQMFLEIEDYMKKKLYSLILNIKINRDDINKMKEDVENVIISYRKMQELMIEQEIYIDDFLCWVIHQKRTIQDLQRQVKKFSILQSALVTQTQSALTLLVMQKDQNVSAMIKSSSVMSFSSLFSSFSYVSLSFFSSDSFLLMTFLFSSLTLITQSIIEEMKNVVSFNMSILSRLFCQYDSLCKFCIVWLMSVRVYHH